MSANETKQGSASEKVNPRKRGLGRGLDALFEDEEMRRSLTEQPDEPGAVQAPARPGRLAVTVGTEQLTPMRHLQPRTLFDEEPLKELAASIREHGVIQPILARPVEDDPGRYEIVAGERRWRAAQMAKRHEVPIIVKRLSDEDAVKIALIENLQREDLNPVDEALAYKRLLDMGHTQEEIADSLGKSRPYVANFVRLLTLPDTVLAHLERGDLSMGHARALIGCDRPEALAREIVSKNLSVRETEKRTAGAPGRSATKAKAGKPGAKGPDTLALEEELSGALGMRVSIDGWDGQKGKLSIAFKSLDQLDEIIQKLSA